MKSFIRMIIDLMKRRKKAINGNIIVDIETTGLDPLKDEITYVGWLNIDSGIPHIKLWTTIREADLKLLEYSDHIIFWGRGPFDIPFLKLQLAKKNIFLNIYNDYNLANMMKQNCDLLKDKHLEDFANFFGVNHMVGHGKDMPAMFKEGKCEVIVEHLKGDLLTVFEIYKLAKRMFLI